MRDIRIAAGQFEARDADKAYNLSRVAALSAKAASQGAEIASFHECCLTGYTFLQTLDRRQMLDLAEPIPGGPSTDALIDIARASRIVVMAGLLERDGDTLLKAYVTVGPEGFITKYHKLHTFINPHLTPGSGYNVIDLRGIQAGFLICYDNNLPENVRATALLGAEVIFMPHVTCGTPSPMPGRGVIDRALWDNRDRDPVRLRMEFEGPKARGWLMKWLPARCWENGIYAVFSNPIGVDFDTVKNGNAMILDPDGEVRAECRTLGDDVVTTLCTADTYERASGRRYFRARRPELYGPLVAPNPGARTEPTWTRTFEGPK